MSFVVAAALAIAALIGLPVLAHLLRRSRAREQEFPPAHLVPQAQPVARQRRRIEDRALLSIRALVILALALLGATPLVECSRLSLDRSSGASVAMAIVLDDSLSMYAKSQGGRRRFDHALAGARELLDSARSGDAVTIVLAGAPPRLHLAATTDLEQVRRALGECEPSDRATDLSSAVKMARAALQRLPHADRRVVVLSDMADDPLPEGQPIAVAPLAQLRTAAPDCGIVQAERQGRRVRVNVACNTASASRDRRLEVVAQAAAPAGDGGQRVGAGQVIGDAPLEVRAGAQLLSLEVSQPLAAMDVRLTGGDALAEDDQLAVAPESAALMVAVIRDPSTSSVLTGGATLLEQALAALDRDIVMRPLGVLPDDAKTLAPFALLIMDDPPGLAAESRTLLAEWLARGRVALAMLGPRVEATQLGSTLDPFVQGAARWEKSESDGADVASLGWLGAAAESLARLEPQGRVLLASAAPQGSQVTARWQDGQPFALETAVGRGLALTTSLPASVEQSDFALRPGFLALLGHAIEQAELRAGPRRSQAGDSWTFAPSPSVTVTGPRGPLALQDQAGDSPEKVVSVANAGRYAVTVGADTHERFVHRAEREILKLPENPDDVAPASSGVAIKSRIDASADLALLLLVLLTAELALRFAKRPARRKPDADATAA
ncbi:MAG: VWA domain-containing protein [Polyangiaceae bacterium]|nr:VWA domain-containing protein [Polyangiaceae bacterium]